MINTRKEPLAANAYRAIKTQNHAHATCSGCGKLYRSPMGFQNHEQKCCKARTIVPLPEPLPPREVGHTPSTTAREEVLKVLLEYEKKEKRTPSGFTYRAIKKRHPGATCFGCDKFYESPMGFQNYVKHHADVIEQRSSSRPLRQTDKPTTVTLSHMCQGLIICCVLKYQIL